MGMREQFDAMAAKFDYRRIICIKARKWVNDNVYVIIQVQKSERQTTRGYEGAPGCLRNGFGMS